MHDLSEAIAPAEIRMPSLLAGTGVFILGFWMPVPEVRGKMRESARPCPIPGHLAIVNGQAS